MKKGGFGKNKPVLITIVALVVLEIGRASCRERV